MQSRGATHCDVFDLNNLQVVEISDDFADSSYVLPWL